MSSATLRIEIELPSDLLAGLNVPIGSLPDLVREWVVLELVREGRITGGKAGELLELSRSGFLALLARRGIPAIDSPPEDLEEDVAVALRSSSGVGEG